MVTPSIPCNTYDIINVENGTIMVDSGSLTLLNNSIYYFNFTQEAGDYLIQLCDNTTREFRVTETYDEKFDKEEDARMYIAIVVLLGIVTLAFVGIAVFQKSKPFQIFFSLLAILMCVIDFFMAGKIADISGADAGLVSNLYTIYGVGLYLLRFLFIIAIIILFFWVIHAIKNYNAESKLKKENEWLQLK